MMKSTAQIDVIETYKELFPAVQLSDIFEDSKIFPDCIPLRPTEAIMNDYEKFSDDSNFVLAEFIYQNFSLPKSFRSHSDENTPDEDIDNHLTQLWKSLERPADTLRITSLIPLPYPYIVPGGRFREIYYWDSYFTMLGLIRSGYTELAENMLANFAHLLEVYGHIPNGNRTYYLSRSQPPFFSLMVDLIAQEKGDQIYRQYLPYLLKEYTFWMQGQDSLDEDYTAHRRVVRLGNGIILNRYWDDLATPRPESYKEDVTLSATVNNPTELYRNLRAACESGWDFSSRWLEDSSDLSTIRTTAFVPVDLNCLLYHLEKTLARCYRINGAKDSLEYMLRVSSGRKKAIISYCRNPESGYYTDYDFIKRKRSASKTMAAAFCLFFEIANKKDAKAISTIWEKNFLSRGGLLTTLVHSSQQWDAPNGWPPLQYMAISGLFKYNLHKPAKKIAQRWLYLNKAVFEHSGKMMEKYNVIIPDIKAAGGEYPTQDGFGWTNGIYLQLSK